MRYAPLSTTTGLRKHHKPTSEHQTDTPTGQTAVLTARNSSFEISATRTQLCGPAGAIDEIMCFARAGSFQKLVGVGVSPLFW